MVGGGTRPGCRGCAAGGDNCEAGVLLKGGIFKTFMFWSESSFQEAIEENFFSEDFWFSLTILKKEQFSILNFNHMKHER